MKSINLKIWQLAWPIILSNITIPLLGMVDIAVVGHDYPSSILSSVAIGSVIFDILFLTFNFLRMSTTGLVAQCPNKPSILIRALLLALVISAVLMLLSPLIWFFIKSFMPLPKNIVSLLGYYFNLRIYSAPATLLNFVLIGYLFGKKNTKMPLIMLLVINCSAIGLDLVLVRKANMGLAGLAYANILSQTLGFIVGIILTHLRYRPFTRKIDNIFDSSNLLQFFNVNKDIFIRTICLMAAIATFTMQGSQLGQNVVAANAILLSMHHFSSYFLDGFAISCEALVGESIGQKNYKKLIKAIKYCFKFSIFVGAILSIFFALCGSIIIDCLSSHHQVITIAKSNLVWLIILPVLSVVSFLLDGVFIGATWTKPMRDTMIISSLIIFLPLTYLLKSYANNGLWLSFIIFIVCRGLFLGLCLPKQLQKFKISSTVDTNAS